MLRDSVPGPSLDRRYSGVRMLWIKVIIRAAYDWVTQRDSTKYHKRLEAKSAEVWLFHESHVFISFENICRYNDVDPERVRIRIRNMSKEDAKKIEYLDRFPGEPGEDEEDRIERAERLLQSLKE